MAALGGRLLALALALLVLLSAGGLPVAAQGSSTDQLVGAFAAAARSGDAAARREAAKRVLAQYGSYQAGLSKVPISVRRALDEELVRMCQETWAEVGSRMGSRLDHVVPVGTLGNRHTNPAYLPGKSDKDFIPRGPGAPEAAGEFEKAFRARYGIAPGSVQVNVLDPTNPSSWPERVRAATNPEKYNTVGGNKWLATEEALQKPNLWRFDPATGTVREYFYESVVRTPPPPLTKGDALGWFSDNTRFRTQIGEQVSDPAMRALKQAKYDLRNLEAFRLAGGTLTEAEQAYLDAARLLREGKTEGALGKMIAATGETDPDRALAAYLSKMDEMNGSMSRFITDSHLTLMGRSSLDAATKAALADELAGSLANLRGAQRAAAIEALTTRLGQDKADEIVRIANAFERRVSFGLSYFDSKAMSSFGKAYDQLSDAEKAVLHGADEAASSWLGKAATVLGVTLSGFAVWNAWKQGQQAGGFGVAAGSAFARALIELAQNGMPLLAAAELAGQLAAGVVQLGAGAYKNAVLEDLYARYKAGETDVLDIQGVLRGYAGGLRQFAIDLRMAEKGLTDAQLEKLILDYFARRKDAERVMAEQVATLTSLMQWAAQRGILPNDILGLDSLEPDQQTLLAGMFEAFVRLRDQLLRDGIPVNDELVMDALWHLYHPSGSFASYQAALRSLYGMVGKTYPPKDRAAACQDKPIVKGAVGDVRVVRKAPPPAGGTLLSGGGSWSQRIDGPCDPAVPLGPVDVTSGGAITAVLDGSPAVPCTWSLYNAGVSLVVDWTPSIGRNEGPTQRLVETRLACDVPDDSDSHVEVSADIPGPGRLSGWLGAPAGAGPLTGECFAQGGTASVTMIEPRPDSPVVPDSALEPGDRIVTGDNGSSHLLVPGFVSVRIRAATDLGVSGPDVPASPADARCGGSTDGLDLARGGIRATTLPGGQPLPIRVSGRTVTPEGTDLVVQGGSDGSGRVAVIEGSAVVTDEQGGAIRLAAGEQLLWPGDIVEPIGDLADLGGPASSGFPVDDTIPAPYGTWPAHFGSPADDAALLAGAGVADAAEGASFLGQPDLPPDWMLVQPGDDVALTFPRPGTAALRVPDRHDLWAADGSAPLLLRKVTGDVDLVASVGLESEGTDYAIVEPVLYAPGSTVGVLAGQMAPQNPAADARLLGATWMRIGGEDRTNDLACADGLWLDRCPLISTPTVRTRLSRRGDLWRTYREADDGAWILTSMRRLAVPETAWVGWTVKRVAREGKPYAATVASFSDVTVTTAPWGSLPPDDWDLRGARGVARLADGGVSLAIDGRELATSSAQLGRELTGDFDVVVRFDPAPWTHTPGESHGFGLSAVSLDELTQAYAAFFEADRGMTLASDLMLGGNWHGWVTQRAYAVPRWLRLARRDGLVTASAWVDCAWSVIGTRAEPMDGPVWLRAWVSDQTEASTPAVVSADARVEWLADGPHTYDEDPWTPGACTVATPESAPDRLVLPPGVVASVSRAPFPVGRAWIDTDGTAYVLSSDRERTGLLAIDPQGGASIVSRSAVMTGISRRSLARVGRDLLVAVDFWPDGGSQPGGIYPLRADGQVTPWPGSTALGGLGDIVAAPDGTLLAVDFEADGLFRIAGPEAPPEQLITAGEVPPGLAGVAIDPADGTIWLLNHGGDSPFGGTPGVYRLADDGSAPLVAAAPEGTALLMGMAVSDGRVLPAGVWASDPAGGRLLHLDPAGTWQTLVEGLPDVAELAFDPLTGDLLATFATDRLVRLSAVPGVPSIDG
jgi:hypothetical protein